MFLIKYLFQPTDAQRILTNNIFFASVLASASLTGSFVSVFTVCALVWPFLWIGRYGELQYAPAEAKLVAGAFALFFLIEAIGCIALGGDQAMSEAVENLPFLAVLPMWWVVQAHPRQMLTTLVKAATIIALIAAFLALVMLLAYGIPRVELSAGNPNVLAIVATVLYLILVVGFTEPQTRWPRTWLAAGILSAIVVIMLTGSRIMWLAILAIPPLAILIMRPASAKLHPRGIGIGLAAALVAAIFLYKPVMQRIHYSQTEIAAIAEGDRTTSVGLRLQLWESALELFREQPWTGVGPGNYQTVIAQKTQAEHGNELGFSHTHNIFFNVMVRDGILGLIALAGLFVIPMIVGLRAMAANGESKRPFMTFLAGLQITYLIAGLTGLAIGHDITDSIFITGTVFAMYGLLFPGWGDVPGQSGASANHQ